MPIARSLPCDLHGIMRRVNRLLRAMLVSVTLVVAACGGSTDSQPPPSSATDSTAIAEADAVARAEAAAADRGFSVDGLEVKPAQLFGEWQVSYEPVDTGSLTGGFLVVLDAQTGELVDLVPYQ